MQFSSGSTVVMFPGCLWRGGPAQPLAGSRLCGLGAVAVARGGGMWGCSCAGCRCASSAGRAVWSLTEGGDEPDDSAHGNLAECVALGSDFFSLIR